MHVLDGNRRQIDAFEATDVDASSFGSRARTTERQDSTVGAEIVLGGPGVPLIQRKLFDRRQQTKTFLFDTMDQRASSTAYRTVANPDVIQIGVHFEPNLTAMTRTFVCLLHSRKDSRPLFLSQSASLGAGLNRASTRWQS
jgi:hypothetical protein